MRAVQFVFAIAICCSGAEAQDEVLTETRQVPQLTASTPLKVRIRQKSRITASGSLISLTEETVKFRTPRGKEVEISIEKISNIRTMDGVLDYSPGRESFADLVARVNEIPGLSAGTTTIEVPIDPKTADSASASDAGNANAPPPDGFPPVLDPAGTAPVADPAQLDPNETARMVPGPFGVVFSCASCKKDLPATIKDGEKCPHCGNRNLQWDSPNHSTARCSGESIRGAARSGPESPSGGGWCSQCACCAEDNCRDAVAGSNLH